MSAPAGRPAGGPVEQAPGHPQVLRVVAPNPGPMTLTGTNSYLVGRDPAYLIDPGPADPGHVRRLREAGSERGGIAGILLTHSHVDHSAAVEQIDAPLLWGRVAAEDETAALAAAFASLPESEDVAVEVTDAPRPAPAPPREQDRRRVGPVAVVPTPGHAPDHVALLYGDACFCGDLILGEGSSIVPPAAGGGSLAEYMASLEHLSEADASLLCPGHGPWITEPAEAIDSYATHRLERERKLLGALRAGERSRRALLDAAWDDVPEPMRPAAALAMQAHLEKLAAEGAIAL